MPPQVDDVYAWVCECGDMSHSRAAHTTARRTLGAALAVAGLVALTGCSAAAIGATFTPTDDTSLGDDDGYIRDGSSLELDSELPAIARLNPALLDALRAAESAADERGTPLLVADGWRSERYQEYLFERAVRNYGSEEEASRWVKRGTDSAHVSGNAVDIATADGMDFLNRFGSEWGLCQTYANEAWHFELLTTPGNECPLPAADGRG